MYSIGATFRDFVNRTQMLCEFETTIPKRDNQREAEVLYDFLGFPCVFCNMYAFMTPERWGRLLPINPEDIH